MPAVLVLGKDQLFKLGDFSVRLVDLAVTAVGHRFEVRRCDRSKRDKLEELVFLLPGKRDSFFELFDLNRGFVVVLHRAEHLGVAPEHRLGVDSRRAEHIEQYRLYLRLVDRE